VSQARARQAASTRHALSGPSGITGHAVVAICTAADASDQSCPHRPVLAFIEVLRLPSQHLVATARTNPAGWFRVEVPPGPYELRAHAAGVILWARPVTTRVLPHRVTDATLRLLPRHPLPVVPAG
jgi:hypothetical protein